MKAILRTATFSGLVLAVAFFVSHTSLVQADSLTFSGTVTFPNGTAFTDGGGVNLWSSNDSGWAGIDTINGTFEITGLEPGVYTLDIGVNSTSAYASPAQQQITITSSISNFRIAVATPTLKGVLAKPDGTPTNGCVNVHNSTWTVNRGNCPAEDGAFKIGALDAGTYTLEASPPGNSPYVTSEQSVTITNPSTTIDLGTVKLDSPFITGKLALPDGSPLTWNDDWNQRLHISVDLWNGDHTINKHSDYDSDSKFKFGRVPAGTYTLHANLWDSDVYTGSANQTITVGESALDLTGTPVRLSTPQLTGVVYRPDGTTPVQNVWVNVYNGDWTVQQGSSTDSNGKYRIGGLAPGTYTFEIGLPNEVSDVVRPDPEQITITASLTTKNVTLSEAKKFVRGTVKKASGAVIACANVNANRRDGSGWAGATTKSDGTYTLTLSPGSWNIRVEPSNNFECPSADWVYMDPEAIVDFSNDASSQTETVNFTVEKTTAKITGTVTLKSGKAITNGNVNANAQAQDGRNRWSNAQIKADGTYTLNLVPGTYELNVWTPDNRLYVKNQKVTVKEGQTLTVNFTVSEKLAHITGTVTSKDGKALSNLQINGNLDCGPNGCSAWSNTRTDASGNFDLAATAGRWFLNFDGGKNSSYVYDGPPVDVYVAAETSTVSGVNFALTYADVTVTGNIVDESGTIFSDFPGWAYVRPTTVTSEAGFREYGGPVERGTFTIRVPSKLFTVAELGVHVPPNSQYSSVGGNTMTLVADSTVEKNITVKKNDAAIVGRIIDSSGLPLRQCNFQGEVFANTEQGEWHGTQINSDCTYEISLLAGSYRMGYHIEESAGFLNRPPKDTLLTVTSGTRAEYNVKVLAGDARVSALVLNPDGTPARRVWVWADNHEEIDRARESSERHDEDENFRGPGDTKSPEEVLKYCSKKENEKECSDFKLPPGAEGPGGCKDALTCTQYCQKNKAECEKEFKGQSVKASTVKLSGSVQRRKARIASLKPVKAQGENGAEEDIFDTMIGTGSETNDVGVATLSLLSGHEYTINAGLPPESNYMPPKTQSVNLLTTKSASLTLTLRTSDGVMSGFVTSKGVAVTNGYVGCWSEDGSNNGSPVINGTYRLNYTFGSVYHCNANASDGTKFLNSEEKIISIGTEKKKRQDFSLGESNFRLPPSVSETFDSTSPHVITLTDGTTINIPANTLATSGDVTVNANPTINIRGQKTAQPLGYGYQLDAADADGKAIVTFKDNITMCFTYTEDQLSNMGIEEGSLVPSYWDAASSSWKLPPNITHDTDNDKICINSNHFTAYAVVSTSGKGRGQQLTAVTTKKASSGVTKVTIGSGSKKKTITPFPKFKGKIDVVTFRAGKKAGQVIVATQAKSSESTTVLKVYDVNGTLSQTIKPWGKNYRDGASLTTGDLTSDTYPELLVSPILERSVKVYDMAKQRNYSVDAGRRGTIVSEALDLTDNGTEEMVTSVSGMLKTWKYSKKAIKAFSYDLRRLRVSGTSIERIALKPTIASVTPKTVTAGKGTVKITITGSNFGEGSRILINQTTPAKKVVAKGETTLVATLDATKLKKNKSYSVTVINADGGQTTYQALKTKK